MIETGRKKKDCYFFTLFGLFWVFLGWLGIASAWLGFFHLPIFIIYILASFFAAISFFKNKKIKLEISQELKILFLSVFLLAFIFSIFAVPTVFSGRDQGSISEAAIRLAQNHELQFSTPASQEFFKIYGSGKALNFPGFYYAENGNLITQFPLGYISWLAIFYSLFSLKGLLIGNIVLFSIFVLSLYFISREFFEKKWSILLLIAVLFSFSFSWILKMTLTENMALALLWFGILETILFLKNNNPLYYFSSLITFGLLAFSRIEGIFFFSFAILTFYLFSKRGDFWKEGRFKKICLPAILFIFFFIVNFSINNPFFREVVKAIAKPQENRNLFGQVFGDFSPAFLEQIGIFTLYGMLGFFILGAVAIIFFAKKKKYQLLIPFLISLPSFFYLINSRISSDHPWMLRRFVFSILPVFIFYSIAFLQNTGRKKIAYFIFSVLIISNLPAFLNYFPFSENRNLLKKTADLSQNFEDRDLVLIDRMASGNGWSMISGPMNFLYGKNSAYFFNPNDLAKIDREDFKNIYIIIPDNNLEFYEEKINTSTYFNTFNDYEIKTTRLETPTQNQFRFPQKQEIELTGKIYKIE